MEALARGVVHGTAGNMSIRDPETGLIAISPSGMPYPTVTPADVVIVDVDGRGSSTVSGNRVRDPPAHDGDEAFPRSGGDPDTHSHYSTVVSVSGMNCRRS